MVELGGGLLGSRSVEHLAGFSIITYCSETRLELSIIPFFKMENMHDIHTFI